MTGWDLSGFHEGHDTECYKRLGAHEMTIPDDERGEVSGTRFAVWAPNAQAVRLVGDFNYWNGDQTAMHLVPGSGVWAVFVEGVGTGTLYKFEVLGADGVWRLKADPFARFCEAAPHTASIVYRSQYAWNDEQWLWYRGQKKQYQEPVSIYEVHLGSWRRGLTYLELAEQLVEYVSWQGYTHVELMPVGGASVRGVVGLPRHRLLRADLAVRLARRVPAPGGRAARGGHRGDRGLGARSLRHRPVGAAALRRHRLVRARGSRGWAGTRTGAPTSSTSAATR